MTVCSILFKWCGVCQIPANICARNLQRARGVCYYNLENVDKLPIKMKDLLQDEKQMQDIVSRGRAKVLDMHTWAKRAEQVVEWIEK